MNWTLVVLGLSLGFGKQIEKFQRIGKQIEQNKALVQRHHLNGNENYYLLQ